MTGERCSSFPPWGLRVWMVAPRVSHFRLHSWRRCRACKWISRLRPPSPTCAPLSPPVTWRARLCCGHRLLLPSTGPAGATVLSGGVRLCGRLRRSRPAAGSGDSLGRAQMRRRATRWPRPVAGRRRRRVRPGRRAARTVRDVWQRRRGRRGRRAGGPLLMSGDRQKPGLPPLRVPRCTATTPSLGEMPPLVHLHMTAMTRRNSWAAANLPATGVGMPNQSAGAGGLAVAGTVIMAVATPARRRVPGLPPAAGLVRGSLHCRPRSSGRQQGCQWRGPRCTPSRGRESLARGYRCR